MEKCIDYSIGKFLYTMTIVTGGARLAQILQGEESAHLDGEFILTAGKKVVILTKDQKPVIVKRWKELNLKKYVKENYPVGAPSYLNVTKLYQDSDGWLWQKEYDNIKGGCHFTVLKDKEILYTISLPSKYKEIF